MHPCWEPDPKMIKTIQQKGPTLYPSQNQCNWATWNQQMQPERRRNTGHPHPTQTAISTFFQQKSPHTWLHPATHEPYQIDHFFIQAEHTRIIKHVKRKSDGTESDHMALLIILHFLKIPIALRTTNIKLKKIESMTPSSVNHVEVPSNPKLKNLLKN